MAKKYMSPVLMEGGIEDPTTSLGAGLDAVREMKDDLSTSFVYGDDNYEEDYMVPDLVEEVITSDVSTESEDQ